MNKNEYSWKYNEDNEFIYYTSEQKNDSLCVYADKKYPNRWMGYYIKNNQSVGLMDETYRKKQSELLKQKAIEYGSSIFKPDTEPTTSQVLSSTDIETMKKKVIYAYEKELRYVDK